MTLKLTVWKVDISYAPNPAKAKAYLDVKGWWNASVQGPWGSESEPNAHGHTEEEVKKKVLEQLQDMYQQIGDFLQEQNHEGIRDASR